MQRGHCTFLERVVLSLFIETQMVIFGSKLKETKAKNVAMATSQYSTSLLWTLVSSFSYLFLEIFLVLWFVSILKAFMMASIFKCQEQLMAWHLLRVARTIIWVVGVNFDQGKFELRGFYVFVHLTCCTAEHLKSHLWYVFRRTTRSLQRRTLYNAM